MGKAGQQRGAEPSPALPHAAAPRHLRLGGGLASAPRGPPATGGERGQGRGAGRSHRQAQRASLQEAEPVLPSCAGQWGGQAGPGCRWPHRAAHLVKRTRPCCTGLPLTRRQLSRISARCPPDSGIPLSMAGAEALPLAARGEAKRWLGGRRGRELRPPSPRSAGRAGAAPAPPGVRPRHGRTRAPPAGRSAPRPGKGDLTEYFTLGRRKEGRKEGWKEEKRNSKCPNCPIPGPRGRAESSAGSRLTFPVVLILLQGRAVSARRPPGPGQLRSPSAQLPLSVTLLGRASAMLHSIFLLLATSTETLDATQPPAISRGR